MVDGVLSAIGTANLDFRSLETNFEVTAFVYDEAFTRQLEAYFSHDLRNSREIIYSDWKKRLRISRMKESLAHLISPMY